jgi:hypothetical protein
LTLEDPDIPNAGGGGGGGVLDSSGVVRLSVVNIEGGEFRLSAIPTKGSGMLPNVVLDSGVDCLDFFERKFFPKEGTVGESSGGGDSNKSLKYQINHLNSFNLQN